MKLFKSHILLYAFLLALVSCRSDFDFKTNHLSEYGKVFVETFGEPHELQTWNTATQLTVNLEIGKDGTFDVSFFSANPNTDHGKSFLLGKFSAVDGKHTSTFKVDAPYTLQSLYVAIEQNEKMSLGCADIIDDQVSVSFIEQELVEGTLAKVDDMTYLLAFEVGDTLGHFDYNDVILGIKHVSGQETADIEVMAIGAKLKMALSYETESDKTELSANLFNVYGINNLRHTINVTSGKLHEIATRGFEGFAVGKDFSIAKDAGRFVLSVTYSDKEKDQEIRLNDYAGQIESTPSNVLLIANPTWTWTYEGQEFAKAFPAFTFWMQSLRLYNDWWDNLWDPRDLVLNGDSYQPNYDFDNLLCSAADIEQNNGECPLISYEKLKDYASEDNGIDIAFSVVGRNSSNIRISVERNDGGRFQWYRDAAIVDMVGANSNVSYGGGNAEAGLVILTKDDVTTLIKNKGTLKVIFDKKDSQTTLNSVWARRRPGLK